MTKTEIRNRKEGGEWQMADGRSNIEPCEQNNTREANTLASLNLELSNEEDEEEEEDEDEDWTSYIPGLRWRVMNLR